MLGEEDRLIFSKKFSPVPNWARGCDPNEIANAEVRSVLDHVATRGMTCPSNSKDLNLAITREVLARNSPWLPSTTAEKLSRNNEDELIGMSSRDEGEVDFSPAFTRDVLVRNWMIDKESIVGEKISKSTPDIITKIVRTYKWSKKIAIKSDDNGHDIRRSDVDGSFMDRIMTATDGAKDKIGEFSKLVFSNEYLPVEMTSRYVKRMRPLLVKALNDEAKYESEVLPVKRAVALSRIENIRRSVNDIIDELSTTGATNDEMKIYSPPVAEHCGELLDLMIFNEDRDLRAPAEMMKDLVVRALEKGSIGEMDIFLKKAGESDRKLFATKTRLQKIVDQFEISIDVKEKEETSVLHEIKSLEDERFLPRHGQDIYDQLSEKRRLRDEIKKAKDEMYEKKWKAASEIEMMIPIIPISRMLKATKIKHPFNNIEVGSIRSPRQ